MAASGTSAVIVKRTRINTPRAGVCVQHSRKSVSNYPFPPSGHGGNLRDEDNHIDIDRFHSFRL
jgi:hypothetical protein